MSIIPNPRHISGGFEWEREPSCSCGLLKTAIENKYIFVSERTMEDSHLCYMVPLTDEGEPFNGDGVQILNCPWCGDKINLKKKRSDSAGS